MLQFVHEVILELTTMITLFPVQEIQWIWHSYFLIYYLCLDCLRFTTCIVLHCFSHEYWILTIDLSVIPLFHLYISIVAGVMLSFASLLLNHPDEGLSCLEDLFLLIHSFELQEWRSSLSRRVVVLSWVENTLWYWWCNFCLEGRCQG